MKTITEFPGMNLKNAAKTKQELITAGKTPEELPAALGEALKLEGTRLEFMLAALEIVGSKLNDLKRAIVYSPQEGEKAPLGLVQKGDHFYLVEYFPSLSKPAPANPASGEGRRDDKKRGNKGGRGGNRGGKPGSEGKGRQEHHSGPGFKRPDAQIIAPQGPALGGAQDLPQGGRPPRGPRPPRAPRPPRPTPTAQTGGAPIIIKPLTPIERPVEAQAAPADPVEVKEI